MVNSDQYSSTDNGKKNKFSNTGQSFIPSLLMSTGNSSNLTSANNTGVINNDDKLNVSQNVKKQTNQKFCDGYCTILCYCYYSSYCSR